MRTLGRWLILGAVLVTLAGGYWAGVAASIKSTIKWVPGLTAETVEIQGFPTRFDLTLSRPTFEAAGGSWRAPALTLTAPAYWPFALDARVSPSGDLSLRSDTGHFTASAAGASVVVRPGPDLRLTQLAAFGAALNWQVSRQAVDDEPMARSGAFHLTAHSVGNNDYAVEGSVVDLRTDLALLGLALTPSDARNPDHLDIGAARIDALVRFDAPVSVLAPNLPPLRAVSQADITVTWGQSEITAQGGLEVDDAGEVSGAFDLDIAGWQFVLDQGRRMNLWDARTHAMLALAAVTFVADSPVDGNLRAPITIRAGVVRVGPLVVGRLPSVH